MSTPTAYPLSWPVRIPRTKIRGRSRFGKGYFTKPTIARAVDEIFLECERLGAQRMVISTNVTVNSLGTPRSGQTEPKDPGVAVYFKLNKRDVCLPCDKWDRVGCNLYAIAKHIEALRGQERWGVGTVDQAFAGYAALPERSASHEAWWNVLGVSHDAPIEVCRAAYREKAKTCHPDAGGSAEAWHQLEAAMREAQQLWEACS